MKPRIRLNPAIITTVVVLFGIAARLAGVPFLDLMELKTVDLRFTARGPVQPRPDVVLATIDEKSIAREGKWVWPRSKLAALTRKLSEAGARVIAFDVGFLETDETHFQMLRALEAIKDRLSGETELLETLRTASDNDRLLADAIADSPAEVVLGYFFHMDIEDTRHVTPAEIAAHAERVRDAKYSFERYTSAAAQDVPLIEAFYPQSNIGIIADAARHAGYFNMLPDPDGAVRWMGAIIRFDEALYAPLSLAAVRAYYGAPLSATIAEFGVESIRIGNQPIPVDEYGRMLINYRGPERTFPHISVTDILNDRVPAEQFRDKIVLVGATAVGIYDLRVTPFGSIFPGLEIHANVIDTVLSADFLRQPAWLAFLDIAGIIVAGIILGIILPRTGVVAGSLTGLIAFGGYIALAQYLFSSQGLVINLVYPLSVILVLYLGITVYRYVLESKQKRFIRDAFSTYLAPSVVQQVIDSPETLALGGEERVITAFFSDVQGFTSISEKLAPRELVELLNEFLTEMTDIILRHKGTVDKFEGDAIIAFFGAPTELPNQARSACEASVEMQTRLAEMRRIWRESNTPELKMRIGLYTGPAVVGNMGSKNRMDYTMMGDTVNTAARLEGVNKIYGTYSLIGERTRREAGDDFLVREVDHIQLLGKKDPIRVYELMGRVAEVDPTIREVVTSYETGLAAYRAQNWDGAVEAFGQVLNLRPDDGPARTLLARCETFREAPPASDWDGAFVMTTK